MSRQELMQSIKDGEAFLERRDLTPAQRIWGEERVAKRIVKLSEMGEEPAPPAATKPEIDRSKMDPKAVSAIKEIRQMLTKKAEKSWS
ncbi:hypothetical protein [Paenibacillus daejeonensis]|uniref:hypothetical protein n=1 Tax=Paenibacillus daejeonensis TaxID=135193 RepID=UPI00036447D5|nr:hypothetical protein [Paenibacillus daejeonensis]